MGLRISKQVNNLLTANQSNMVSGWIDETGANATLAYSGNVATITANNDATSPYVDAAINGVSHSGKIMTGAVEVKATGMGANTLRVIIRDFVGGSGSETFTTVTPTAEWARYSVGRTLRTPLDDEGASLRLRVQVVGTIPAGAVISIRRAQLEESTFSTPWQIGGTPRTPERYTLTTDPCPATHDRGFSMVMPVASTTAVTRTIWRQGAYRLYIDGADNKAKFTNGIATAATSALTWAIGDKVHVYGGRDGTNLIVGAKVGSAAYVEGSTAGAHVVTDSLLWLGNRTIAPFYDGVDDLITVPDHSSIQNIFDGGGEVSFKFKADGMGSGTQGRVFGKRTTAYIRDLSGANCQLRFDAYFSTASGTWRTTDRVITIGKTHEVTIQYNADNVANDPTFIIDGTTLTVGAGLTESSSPVGTRTTDVGTNLVVGRLAHTGLYYFHGLIWDFKYGSGLHLPMNEATGTTVYDSVGANNGAITGCAWQALSCVDATVYNFCHHEGSAVSIASYMAGVS